MEKRKLSTIGRGVRGEDKSSPDAKAPTKSRQARPAKPVRHTSEPGDTTNTTSVPKGPPKGAKARGGGAKTSSAPAARPSTPRGTARPSHGADLAAGHDDDLAPVASVPADRQRFGFVAVIGATNAGKSTLVNRLVGTKVTIVSHKVQTTRMPIRGIAIDDASQLVFVDTPGIFKPRRRLDRAMVQAAWGGAGEADIIVFLFDAQRGVDDETRALVSRLADMGAPACLALNKVDMIAKERLLNLAQELNAHGKFKATFMISALKGSGVDDLKRYLAQSVPQGVWHYPAEDVTDAPMRILASEITREKIYARLHEELPYATTVETTSWKEMGKKGVRIEQTIFVERDSQKSIVLGEGGRAIKQISTESRAELTDIVGRPVHLFLFVKVREGWEHDPERYREMGLEFPSE